MWALAIRDFYTWLGHQFTGRDIDTTHTTFTNTIAVADTSVTGSPSAPETVAGSSSTPASGHKSTSPSAVVKYNLTMPANLEKKENAVFEMRHEITLSHSIRAFDVTDCNNLLMDLITELNSKFMTELGYASVTEQSAATDDTEDDFHDTKFIFIGGSHAARLAAAADNANLTIKNLSVPGFRITPDNIENAALLL
jgi:hypothetical protein